jgi:DNA repair exonuclease SbcCD ATPase subunit
MTKNNILTGSIILLILLLLSQGAYFKFGEYKERIARVEAEKRELSEKRMQLEQKVNELNTEQINLKKDVEIKRNEISDLRGQVRDLDAKLNDDRVAIVRIQGDDESIKIFKAEFPEFSAGMRIVEEVKRTAETGGIEVPINYIMLPVGFVDHFVELKKISVNYGLQNEKLKEMDDLHIKVAQLSSKILVLETEKAQAYQQGYIEAFEKYQNLSSEYVKLMKEKRVGIGGAIFQTLSGILAGIAVGSAL